MSAELKGRTALVTGATSGIGRGVAQALAAAGAQVIVHGRDAARGAEVVDGIISTGGAGVFVAADLAAGAAAITPLAVSVKAPILLTAALVPAMAERGGGVAINMGSINGITGMARTALYSATKSAIHTAPRFRSARPPCSWPATTPPTSTAPSSS